MWSRVEAVDPSVESAGLYCAERQGEALRALIAKKRLCAAECRRLSAVSSGSVRQLLRRMVTDAQKQERSLQSQYFILTGDTCPMTRDRPRAGGLMSGLRGLLLLTQECASALEDLSRAAPDMTAAQTLRDLASADLKWSSELRRLIESSIK